MDFIIKTVDVPLYRGKFSICIGDTEYDVPGIYKSLDDSPKIIFAHSFLCNIQETDESLMYKKVGYSDIAHEASHIAKFISKNRGFIADYDNDEPEAYLIGWITNEVMKLLIQNNIHVITD